MPRVSHIMVAVMIQEDDGSESTHIASGEPGFGVVASLVPHYRTQISRSQGRVVAQEVVAVHVELQATLHPDGQTRLFGVDHDGIPSMIITESP